jgi:beta-lactamase class D
VRNIILAEKTEKGALYGKTGSGMDSDYKWNLGWFVGFLEHDGLTYVFTFNSTDGESSSGIMAKQIVIDYFKAQGLF